MDVVPTGRPVMYASVNSRQFAPMRKLFDLFKKMMGEQYPVKSFVVDKMAVRMRAARVVFGCDVMPCYICIKNTLGKRPPYIPPNGLPEKCRTVIFLFIVLQTHRFRQDLQLLRRTDPRFVSCLTARWLYITRNWAAHAQYGMGHFVNVTNDRLEDATGRHNHRVRHPGTWSTPYRRKRKGVLATRTLKTASCDADLDRREASQHTVSRESLYARVFEPKEGLLGSCERQPLNDKNKTNPENLSESLDPVYQSVNPRIRDLLHLLGSFTSASTQKLLVENEAYRRFLEQISINQEAPDHIIQRHQETSDLSNQRHNLRFRSSCTVDKYRRLDARIKCSIINAEREALITEMQETRRENEAFLSAYKPFKFTTHIPSFDHYFYSFTNMPLWKPVETSEQLNLFTKNEEHTTTSFCASDKAGDLPHRKRGKAYENGLQPGSKRQHNVCRAARGVEFNDKQDQMHPFEIAFPISDCERSPGLNSPMVNDNGRNGHIAQSPALIHQSYRIQYENLLRQISENAQLKRKISQKQAIMARVVEAVNKLNKNLREQKLRHQHCQSMINNYAAPCLNDCVEQIKLSQRIDKELKLCEHRERLSQLSYVIWFQLQLIYRQKLSMFTKLCDSMTRKGERYCSSNPYEGCPEILGAPDFEFQSSAGRRQVVLECEFRRFVPTGLTGEADFVSDCIQLLRALLFEESRYSEYRDTI
ncbi:hypothetical protein CLF_101371 [Clonorchis sinensis]|uniref:Uncharacterized protein n=1 Tax=Clonorchis sinensis TaxID=79923 RepID=G7Y5L5_CLOSI|nr:hypothetical protein CLF_101371 [Clonorchis sinensis]